MAKSKKAAAPDGPHLAAAFFCERLLQEKDGVPSFIRAVDVLTTEKPELPPPGPNGEPNISPVTPIQFVVIFKSGDAKGERTVRIDAVFPSGKVRRGKDNAVHFLGGAKGVNLHGQTLAPISEEGLYWYDVFLDDKRVTRMPLQIVHQTPIPETQTTPSADSPETDSPKGKRPDRKGGTGQKRG